ncbi:MAG: cytochrome c biogenesis protein ResB [Deltaproteobacteria bacterium]|nr:cytochrome c biogenesis protein ResB [Deltaproteobacteria bacterium]
MKKKKEEESFKERIWSFFASVKLSVVLLLVLAVTSIIGTVIPQNEDPASYFQRYGEALYKIFKFLGLFDMYHSWWFLFILMMLTINLVVCSFNRLPTVWRIVSVKNPKFNKKRFNNIRRKDSFIIPSSPEKLKSVYESYIIKKLRYCHSEETDAGFVLYAERGRWTRMGVYIVHLSIIILFIGAIFGSLFGYNGWVNIPEGETVDHIRLRENSKPYQLDFALRCNEFKATFYDSGMPKEYKSSLTIIENGQEVLTRSIVVNDPLRYKGVSFYQSGYGTLPPDRVTLKLVDYKAGKPESIEAPLHKKINLPDNQGYFKIVQFVSDFMNAGPAFQVQLVDDGKPPVAFRLFKNYPNMDRMRKGRYLFSIESYPEVYYTGLQVTADPGVWVVYAGCILLIIGISITFFMSHNRLFVQVVRDKEGSRVTIAGTANKNRLAFEDKVEKITEGLQLLS